jgi:hypothetical protein
MYTQLTKPLLVSGTEVNSDAKSRDPGAAVRDQSGGPAPNRAALLAKLDAAIARRRKKTFLIPDEELNELRQGLLAIWNDPKAPGTAEHIAWMQKDVYQVAAGNWQEFQAEFLPAVSAGQQHTGANHPESPGSQEASCPVGERATELAEQPQQERCFQSKPGIAGHAPSSSPASQTNAVPPVWPPKKMTLGYWASRINNRATAGVEALIEAGRELPAAKAELGHGEFQKLFDPGVVRFEQRTAERLMKVAKNEAPAKSTNWSTLSTTLHSLNALAGVEPDALATTRLRDLLPRGNKLGLAGREAPARRPIQVRPEDRPAARKAAVELADGHEVTARHIKRAVQPLLEPLPRDGAHAAVESEINHAHTTRPLHLVEEIKEAVKQDGAKEKFLALLNKVKQALSRGGQDDAHLATA